MEFFFSLKYVSVSTQLQNQKQQIQINAYVFGFGCCWETFLNHDSLLAPTGSALMLKHAEQTDQIMEKIQFLIYFV